LGPYSSFVVSRGSQFSTKEVPSTSRGQSRSSGSASLLQKEGRMVKLNPSLRRFFTTYGWLPALLLVSLMSGRQVVAFKYVTDVNGTWWGIQDSTSPNVDTGSIRATQTGPGDCLFNACTTPAYSTTINGFGGIKILVKTTAPPRLNGEMMRGYGLVFDGNSRFKSTQSIDLGGIVISRSVFINTNANWGRWLDT